MERPVVGRVLNDAANASAVQRKFQDEPLTGFAIVEPSVAPETDSPTRWITRRDPAHAQWSQFQPETTSAWSNARAANRFVSKLTPLSSDTQQTSPDTFGVHKSQRTDSSLTLKKDTVDPALTFRATSSSCGTDFEWLAVPTVAAAVVSECKLAPSKSKNNNEEAMTSPAMASPVFAPEFLPPDSGTSLKEGTTVSTLDFASLRVESNLNVVPDSKTDSEGQVAQLNRIKDHKVAILPSTILPGYPGFCDVRDLTLEERKPWLFLGKKKAKETQKTSKPIKAKKSPHKQYTITPTTWKEQIKLFQKKIPGKIKNVEEANEDSKILNNINFQNTDAHITEDGDLHSPKKSRIEESSLVNSHIEEKKQLQKKVNYDRKAAREYIKKQRLMRQEKCAKELQEKKQAEEIKKHNYKVLLEKSTKLVKSNLKRTLNQKLIEEVKEDGLNADSKEPDRKCVLVPPPLKLQRSPRKRGINDTEIPNVMLPLTSQKPTYTISKLIETEPDQTSSRGVPLEGTVECLQTNIGDMTLRSSGGRLHSSNPHKSSQCSIDIEEPPQINFTESYKSFRAYSLEVRLPLSSMHTMDYQSSETNVESSQRNIDDKSYFSAVPSSLLSSTCTATQSSRSNLEHSEMNSPIIKHKTAQPTELTTKPLQTIIGDNAFHRANPSSKSVLPSSGTFKVAKTSRNGIECSQTDDNRYYSIPSVSRGTLPSQKLNNYRNSTSKLTEEAIGLAVDAQHKILGMNHKLQSVLTLASEQNPVSSSQANSNANNIDSFSPTNTPTDLKTHNRDVTDDLLTKVLKLNERFEKFRDNGSRNERTVSKQRNGTHKVQQSMPSGITSMPSKLAKDQLRQTRKLTTKYPKISLPGENHSIHHHSSLRSNVKNYPGTGSMTFINVLDTQTRHHAAIKIQALYRGYRVRKNMHAFKMITFRSVRKRYQLFKYPGAVKSEVHHSDLNKKTLCDASVINAENLPKEISSVNHNKRPPEVLPDWLQPELLQPCPYNFMSAVKRKLDLLKRDGQLITESDSSEVKPSIVNNKVQRLAQTLSTENNHELDESHYLKEKSIKSTSSLVFQEVNGRGLLPNKEVIQHVHDSRSIGQKCEVEDSLNPTEGDVLSNINSGRQICNTMDKDSTLVHSSTATRPQKSLRKKHRLTARERLHSRHKVELDSSRSSTSEDHNTLCDRQNMKDISKRTSRFQTEKERHVSLDSVPCSILIKKSSVGDNQELLDTSISAVPITSATAHYSREENTASDTKYPKGTCGNKEEVQGADASMINDESLPKEISSVNHNKRPPEVLPDWLQPELLQPCPYNFMSAVKRKLDLLKSEGQLITESDSSEVKPSIVNNKVQRLAQTLSTENNHELDESHYLKEKSIKSTSSLVFQEVNGRGLLPNKEVIQHVHDSRSIGQKCEVEDSLNPTEGDVLSNIHSGRQICNTMDKDSTLVHSSTATRPQKSLRKKHRLTARDRLHSRHKVEMDSSRSSTSEDHSTLCDRQNMKDISKRTSKFQTEKERHFSLDSVPCSILIKKSSVGDNQELLDTSISAVPITSATAHYSREENTASDTKYPKGTYGNKEVQGAEALMLNEGTLPREIVYDDHNRRQPEMLQGWLQPEPCPYNIMTIVQRKLDLLTRDGAVGEVKASDANNKEQSPGTDINFMAQQKCVHTIPLSSIRVLEGTGECSDKNFEYIRENLDVSHNLQGSITKGSYIMPEEVKAGLSSSVEYQQSLSLPIEGLGQQLFLREALEQQTSYNKSDKASHRLKVPGNTVTYSSTSVRHHKQHIFKIRDDPDSEKSSQLHSSKSISEDTHTIGDQQSSKSIAIETTYQTEKENSIVLEKGLTSNEIVDILSTEKSSGNTVDISYTKIPQKIPVEEMNNSNKSSHKEMTIKEMSIENNSRTSTEEIPDNGEENTVSEMRHSGDNSTKNLEIGKLFHPTALHLQFQAELNLLDSVEESRRQLATVESLRAVTLSQQNTLAVASALKTTKDLHKYEVGELEKRAAKNEESIIETFAIERKEFERLLDNVKNKTLPMPDNASLASSKEASTKYSQSKNTEGEKQLRNSNNSSSSPIDSILENVDANSHSTGKRIPDTNKGSSVFSLTSISEQISDRDLSSMGIGENNKIQLQSEDFHEEAESLLKQKDYSTYSYLKTSLLMFEKQLKHEDVRNQEQIVLLNLREKTLVDRAKADMAWLEVKKSQLREKGRENLIPTVKKKQRALIIKLQSDIDDIKRLKKIQKIASEERELIMIQQQNLLKMQLFSKADNLMSKTNTKISTQLENIRPLDILLPGSSKSSRIISQINKLETSDHSSKGKPLSTINVTEISEQILSSHSNSTTENSLHGSRKMETDENSSINKSFKSIENESSGVIEEVSLSTSTELSEILNMSGNNPDSPNKMVIKSLGERVLKYMKTLEKHKRYLNEQEKVLVLRRQSVEELLLQRKRLEDEEQRLSETERQAITLSSGSKNSHKPIMGIKSLQDRSTSPVQVLDKVSSSSEKMESKSSATTSEHVITASDQSFLQSNHSIPEEVPESYNRPSSDIPSALTISTGGSIALDQYASESFGSPESPETPRTEVPAPHSTSEISEELGQTEPRKMHIYHKSESEFRTVVKSKKSELILKAPLSPFNHGQQKRRYSSGSDESLIYSQTEPSEQSDLECRVSALLEQLRRRKLEAEKLRKEQKRTQRERLKSKEQSLLKQIQAYDSYIHRIKEELEQDFDNSTICYSKPKIKQPRVAEKSTARGKRDEGMRLSQPSDALISLPATDTDIVSIESSLHEQTESSGTCTASNLLLDAIVGDLAPVSSKLLEEPIDLHLSIADKIATEVSYSDPEVSTAISLTSENEINDNSIEGNSQASVSQRSITPDSSLVTTVHSSLKISELEVEAKEDHVECVDNKLDISVCEINNEFNEELVAVNSDMNIELDKSESHVSDDILDDEHLTISLGDRAEDPDELSVENNSEVIKVFLIEKVVKSELCSQDVENDIEENISVHSSTSSLETIDTKKNQEHYVLQDHHDMSPGIVDGRSEDLNNEMPLEAANTEADNLKALQKHNNIENIIDIIFNELLNETLCISVRATKLVHVSETFESIDTDNIERVVEPQIYPTEEIVHSSQEANNELQIKNEDVNDIYPINKKPDTDNITSILLNDCISDATNEILKIYNMKKEIVRFSCVVTKSMLNVDSLVDTQEDNDSIRNRVHKILVETSLSLNSSRETSRLQDFMVTTYDVQTVSPEDTPSITPDLGSPTKGVVEGEPDELEELQNNEVNQNNVELGVGLSVGGESEGTDNEGFTQEWFDEDYGLSNTRREAEELRLQQLQIEQEIQQLQQAQEQIPFFYVREIPNKPPPPYTPPGQTSRNSSGSPAPGVPRIPLSKQDLTRLASEESRIVPATRSELCTLASVATDFLYSAIQAGADLDLVQAPPHYYQEEDVEGDGDCDGEDSSESHRGSQNIFKTFIFDLTKQLVKDAYGWEADEPCAPWQWPACSRKRNRIAPRSREMLQEMVCKQVLVLFGFIPKASKENLVIRWSRKRRDYVDELLMRESHEEEPGWTNYDQDEVTVKNEVTMSIYNSLLDDTMEVVIDTIDKKFKNDKKC